MSDQPEVHYEDIIRNYHYNMLIKEHPALNLYMDFDSFTELCATPDIYVQEYERTPIAKDFPNLREYYLKISQNNALGIRSFRDAIHLYFGKQYYKLLKKELSYDDFVAGMTSFLQRYFQDNNFEAFWEHTHLKNIITYSKSDTDLLINNTIIQADSDNFLNFEKSITTGGPISNDATLRDVIRKILFVQIYVPDLLIHIVDTGIDGLNLPETENEDQEITDVELLQKIFNKLDERLINLANPSKLKINSIEDLKKLHIQIETYMQFIFSIHLIVLLDRMVAIPAKIVGTDVESQIIAEMMTRRIDLMRVQFLNYTEGNIYFEESYFLKAVVHYFAKKYTLVKTDKDKTVFLEEVGQLYIAFPVLREKEFLKMFAFADKTQGELKDKQPKEPTLIVNINGIEMNIYDFRFKEELEDMFIQLNPVNGLKASQRISRQNIWNDLVIKVLEVLKDAPDNLETIKKLEGNRNGRVQIISQYGPSATKGGDRVIVASMIDDGKSTPYFAIIYILEFTDKGNKIKVLVKEPEDVIVSSGKTATAIEQSIDHAVEKEEKTLSEIPKFILDFLNDKDNNLPDFNFDIETEVFPEAVAFYIAYLLTNKPTFRNQSEKHLIERFLILCVRDSKVKESIVSYLSDLVKKGQIEVNFGSSRHPEGIFSFKPRIIARNILHYLTRNESNSGSEYDFFTDEAKVIFERKGKPKKSTGTKEWILKDSTRIHFCYVDDKLEIAITWHYHT